MYIHLYIYLNDFSTEQNKLHNYTHKCKYVQMYVSSNHMIIKVSNLYNICTYAVTYKRLFLHIYITVKVELKTKDTLMYVHTYLQIKTYVHI